MFFWYGFYDFLGRSRKKGLPQHIRRCAMSKSHTAVWASDAPTPAQLSEFFRQIQFGRVTKSRLQSFLRGEVQSTFSVTVDYTLALPEMITAGKYDWVNSDITQKHFPVIGEGKVERELILVHFGRNMGTEAVLEDFDKQNLQSATIEELLALGATHPELQRQFPIIALGSVWQHPGGGRCVPYLGEDSSERCLSLDWYDDGWADDCRFLAARK